MRPLWDPQLTLNLRPGGQADWTCAGICYPPAPSLEAPPKAGCDDNDDDASPPRPAPAPEAGYPRCTRRLRPAEINKMHKLLGEISHQMPDQVEYNVLLHLARASLCVDQPSPHQGQQEASVIYEWTRLMSVAAETLRSSEAGSPTAAAAAAAVATTSTRSRRPQPLDTTQRRRSPSNTATAGTPPGVALVAAPPPSHSQLPPSPPDSATTPFPFFSNLPFHPEHQATNKLHHPAPIPIRIPPALAALPALPTGTTIDTTRSADGEDDDDNDDDAATTTTSSDHTTPHAFTRRPPSTRSPTTTIANSSSLSSRASENDAHPSLLRRLPRTLTMARDDTNDPVEPAPRPRPRGQGMSHPQPPEMSLPALPGVVGRGLPGGGGGAMGLAELEEYNRLLQETQARQEVVLRQTALLRQEMEALRAARRRQRQGEEGEVPDQGEAEGETEVVTNRQTEVEKASPTGVVEDVSIATRSQGRDGGARDGAGADESLECSGNNETSEARRTERMPESEDMVQEKPARADGGGRSVISAILFFMGWAKSKPLTWQGIKAKSRVERGTGTAISGYMSRFQAPGLWRWTWWLLGGMAYVLHRTQSLSIRREEYL